MVPASVSYAVCCPVSSVLRPPGGESLGRGGFSCRPTRCSAWQLRCESPAGCPGVALRPEPEGGRIHDWVITDPRGWVHRAQSGDTLGLAQRGWESPLPIRVVATGLSQGIETSEARPHPSSSWDG